MRANARAAAAVMTGRLSMVSSFPQGGWCRPSPEARGGVRAARAPERCAAAEGGGRSAADLVGHGVADEVGVVHGVAEVDAAPDAGHERLVLEVGEAPVGADAAA